MPLLVYSGWASAFGEPKKGAEAADRLLRIDPTLRAVTPGGLAYPYFMAGRYQDALDELTAKAEDSLDRVYSAYKAGALAMLDRGVEAKAVVARTLGRFPDVTIEGLVNRPEWADPERKRLAAAMAKAGFPACSPAGEIAQLARPFPLPECEAERAKLAASKS